MTNGVKSSISQQDAGSGAGNGRAPAGPSWLKVGAVAAASAALGGLAAAWFYRKTLSRLRDAEDEFPDSVAESTEDGTPEDF